MERSTQRLGRALVVIVDDRVVHGENDDKTGPLVTELLEETGFIVDGTVAVAGEMVDIRNALNTAVIGGVDLVVTVGGTGVSPRDVTPRSACWTGRFRASRRRSGHPVSPPAPWTRAFPVAWLVCPVAHSWSIWLVHGRPCGMAWPPCRLWCRT
jgi:Probable molybdopterin binding domain